MIRSIQVAVQKKGTEGRQKDILPLYPQNVPLPDSEWEIGLRCLYYERLHPFIQRDDIVRLFRRMVASRVNLFNIECIPYFD